MGGTNTNLLFRTSRFCFGEDVLQFIVFIHKTATIIRVGVIDQINAFLFAEFSSGSIINVMQDIFPALPDLKTLRQVQVVVINIIISYFCPIFFNTNL